MTDFFSKLKASEAESAEPMPGDKALSDYVCQKRYNLSVHLPVSTDRAWRWISQIGRGAGYYTYDELFNAARPSANYILDLPEPLTDDENKMMGRLIAVEPEVGLAWATLSRPTLLHRLGWVIAYKLCPHECGASLLARLTVGTEGVLQQLMLKCAGVIGYILLRRQLANMARIVASYPVRKQKAETNREIAPLGHQRDFAMLATLPEPIPSVPVAEPAQPE